MSIRGGRRPAEASVCEFAVAVVGVVEGPEEVHVGIDVNSGRKLTGYCEGIQNKNDGDAHGSVAEEVNEEVQPLQSAPRVPRRPRAPRMKLRDCRTLPSTPDVHQWRA
eukprot:GHVU01034007.1.p1 GENE.GHVU01034007.1~~GHVU01034007.1.p1  ORF type:complete len:124 (-),score=20.66 GHVU01034007.1:448-771(-)